MRELIEVSGASVEQLSQMFIRRGTIGDNRSTLRSASSTCDLTSHLHLLATKNQRFEKVKLSKTLEKGYQPLKSPHH